MKFASPIKIGTFIERPNRFVVMIKDNETKKIIAAYCPNTGSLQTIIRQKELKCGFRKIISPKGKMSFIWEIAYVNKSWVSVHSLLANKIFEEAITKNIIFPTWIIQKKEPHVSGSTRLDFILSHHDSDKKCYIEVKSVSMSRKKGLAEFPDSITKRGLKHIHALKKIHEEGGCLSYLIFVVQREDCHAISIARDIDYEYYACLRRSSINIIGIRCTVSTKGIYPKSIIPCKFTRYYSMERHIL